mmetsp:Transcript_98759/g.318521  ORF Transcript_98759/g.318521 Transcript_98759/m.318521 type:complete len:493 (+) Transcript_98759:74-1552(+)
MQYTGGETLKPAQGHQRLLLEQRGQRRRAERDVAEVIEEIGFGRGQLVALVLAGGTFLAEGLELLIVALLGNAIAADLGAPSSQEGLLIAAGCAGALVGNMLSGPFADLVGRQFPITMAYSFVVIFGVVSSFMNSVPSLSLMRFFTGAGLGLGQPAALALMSEVLPERWRLRGIACSSLLFGLGMLLAVLMVATQDSWHRGPGAGGWGLALRGATLPSILLGLCSIFLLPESPAFLAASGDHALARDVLMALQSQNGRPGRPVLFRTSRKGDFQHPPPPPRFGGLLDPSTLVSMLVVCSSTFVLNCALYGSGYVVPQALAEIAPQGHKGFHTPSGVLVVALAAAGLLLIGGAAWGSYAGRKTGILSCMTVSLVAAMLFPIVAYGQEPGSGRWLLVLLSCLGLCGGPAIGVLFLLQTATTFCPAALTATGAAACLACGRLGSLAAPLVIAGVQGTTGAWQPVFYAMAMLELGCMMLVLPLPFARPEGRLAEVP